MIDLLLGFLAMIPAGAAVFFALATYQGISFEKLMEPRSRGFLIFLHFVAIFFIAVALFFLLSGLHFAGLV